MITLWSENFLLSCGSQGSSLGLPLPGEGLGLLDQLTGEAIFRGLHWPWYVRCIIRSMVLVVGTPGEHWGLGCEKTEAYREAGNQNEQSTAVRKGGL